MFKPTEKQQQAIINMTSALGISNLEYFSTAEEFQNYFKGLGLEVKKLKKRARFNKAVRNGKIDLKKIEEKKQKYYTENPEKLSSKARDYVNRYNPSIKKLEAYMRKKTMDKELIQKIIEEINIDERKVITHFIDIKRNILIEPYHKIKAYLFRKQFDKDLIDELINLKQECEEDEGFYRELEYKVQRMCQSRKSKRQLEGELYNLGIKDRDYVEELFDKYYDVEEQEKLLALEIERVKDKYTEEKLISKFMRMGYSYNEIKKSI